MIAYMESPHDRIYQLKVILVALTTALIGLGLLFVARYADVQESLSWLRYVPIMELGSTLFITGSLVVGWEYFDGRGREAREDARIRRLLGESAPAFKDAVVRGFAVESDDLKRVATPELLDDITTNTLALRLGDRDFARELYTDLRDQAIKAPERWYDARVSIDLGLPRNRTVDPTCVFNVVVRWEYTVEPKHRFRKFAIVSDRQRYDELAAEGGETSVWLKSPTLGLDVADRATFELVQFTAGGVELAIRRDASKTGQTYTVDLAEVLEAHAGQVAVSFTYRLQVAQTGHLLYFDIDRPTRGFDMTLNYSHAGVATMKVVDHISSSVKARVTHTPKSTGQRSVTVGYDGWVLPRAGVAFVWTLDEEVSPDSGRDDAHHTLAA